MRLSEAERTARRDARSPAYGQIDPGLVYEDPSAEVARLNAEAAARRVH